MFKFVSFAVLIVTFAVVTQSAGALFAQSREAAIVYDAEAVLDEVMRIPARGIPRSLLSRAHGVVIIPGMLKGGFIVGIRHGRGVALIRDEQGNWNTPRFVEMTGGSFGFQAGVQSTDIILVFLRSKSVEGLLHGTFTLGVDAAAAAGPVGRNLAAATDERLRAEILSYSRSRGFFAGVSLDGSSIQIDYAAERAFYGPKRRGGPTRVPESAVRLIEKLSQYSGSPTRSEGSKDEKESPNGITADPEQARRKLAEASVQLAAVLSDDWRRYLALPAAVYGSEEHPEVDRLEHALGRFDRVAEEARYRALAARAEFQKTRTLVREYLIVLAQGPSGDLVLPPPPKN